MNQTIRGIRSMADGEHYTTLEGSNIIRHSYAAAGPGERMLPSSAANLTITDYSFSPDERQILIASGARPIYRHSYTTDYFLASGNSLMPVLREAEAPRDASFSPDGKLIAYSDRNDLYVYDTAGKRTRRITDDGAWNSVINGTTDWVYEEEFGFNSALTFNADGSMICWIKYDEKEVPQYSLQMFKGMKPENKEYAEYPGLYTYKYPKAGQKNSVVSVYSYDIKSHQTRKLQVPVAADGYIPRLFPTKDAQKMIVFTNNRHQDELCIYAVNPRSTVAQLLIKEKNSKYVPEEAMDNIKITDSHILLPSDRDGYMQLYLYSMTGSLVKKITSGNRDVTDVYGYDEATGNTYYQAAGKDPMNREVYVTAKNGKTQCLTPRLGWNMGTFSKGFKYFVNCWSDMNTPFEFTMCSNSGKQIAVVNDNKELKDKLKEYNLPQKEFFSFTTSEGVKLNGIMVKPHDFDPNKKYPVIMWQYSGPGSQQVTNAWNVGSMGQACLYDGYLADRGFILVCVDGRGTGGRGAEFMKCTYLKIGDLESKDQVETALYLGTLPYVDKDNIGIWGWSFGGFNTLMSMSEGRGVFKAGVSVAPPTDWRFYDTIYTERYMRTPNENPTGYDVNPIKRAGKLHGSLLICHGLADDNVHPQNTFEYTEALVQADKDFRMNIYTNRNHSIYGGNTRNHLLRQIADFFVEKMK